VNFTLETKRKTTTTTVGVSPINAKDHQSIDECASSLAPKCQTKENWRTWWTSLDPVRI